MIYRIFSACHANCLKTLLLQAFQGPFRPFRPFNTSKSYIEIPQNPVEFSQNPVEFSQKHVEVLVSQ